VSGSREGYTCENALFLRGIARFESTIGGKGSSERGTGKVRRAPRCLGELWLHHRRADKKEKAQIKTWETLGGSGQASVLDVGAVRELPPSREPRSQGHNRSALKKAPKDRAADGGHIPFNAKRFSRRELFAVERRKPERTQGQQKSPLREERRKGR